MSSIFAFGYHDQNAPRHWNICKQLRGAGHDIIECHTTKKGFFGKSIDLWKRYGEIQNKTLKIHSILVTFPGHYLMPLAWCLTRFPRKKLIFDAFISLYDTNVCDRKRFATWSLFAWFLFFVDVVSCHLADEVLVDTKEHKKYFVKMFRLKPEKVRVIYLGTREDLFYKKRVEGSGYPLNAHHVLFYGTYIPLQGIEYILDAANILQHSHPQIHFTLIGRGQTYPEMRALAEKLKLQNITFKDPVPYEELPDLIRGSHLCLGVFGTTAKASRVIPHKVYDAVACAVPIVTADTPAIREKFADHKGVILCEAGSGDMLARRITDYFS
ncbi:hypothetical protein COU77_01440 [Candidatus Peregrinibacteria bacterium CG10_big_fil_rev_8_21_14_0_10_49_16]|nr:MAG: hypothetical protein COW95_01190 [Candidatus Peregrinibacteria bacterium CG22_combo_CG10-13_8_21_14_all_49_11]PIR52237.1 MAG: hypothetical protein COU77_01440 [Candidatus Peregrinibacteria bacterium CG10_big_fil_rev_8_21_14_0_10_49_16]